MERGRAELLLILSALYITMWGETSGHHLCFLGEKTRSGKACTGTMRRFTPDIPDISVPTLILGRAMCTQRGNAKQMDFLYAHFRYTAKTFTIKTSLKGSLQYLIASVRVFMATAVA